MIYTWRTLTPVIFDHLLSGRLTTYEFKSRNVTAFSRRFSRNTVNPLMDTLKPRSNVPLYSNTVIGTLAVDGWAVTFGRARRGLGGLRPRPVPSSLYQM